MEEGKRFSQIYLERGAPTRDSPRFRKRLGAYYEQNISKYDSLRLVAKRLEKEIGLEVPVEHGEYSLPKFFETAELRDVLDSITQTYKALERMNYIGGPEEWTKFVARCFQEENLGYQLDSKCGVHYFVDEEFERNRVSTLAALDDPKLSGVRDAYEAAYHHMDSDPPDTKAAVRSMFESLEILVRQIMPGAKNLNKWLVENTLKKKCVKLYESEPTAVNVTSALFDGFADWVDGLHNYRHGQPSEEPVAPKEEVAVYVLSSGSAFLRWLIGINADLTKQKKLDQGSSS